jgi:hypothetical protein
VARALMIIPPERFRGEELFDARAVLEADGPPHRHCEHEYWRMPGVTRGDVLTRKWRLILSEPRTITRSCSWATGARSCYGRTKTRAGSLVIGAAARAGYARCAGQTESRRRHLCEGRLVSGADG